MNYTNWLESLQQDTDPAPIYSDSNEFLCSAEHLGVIKVTGDDAETFLQNQFSNDIKQIDDNTCQLNSYSTHKGRMYAIFYVLKKDDGYLIILPKTQLTFILQRLQMFVIMAKVTLSDDTENWAKIGFQSAEMTTQYFENESANVCQHDHLISIRQNPNSPHRVLLLTNLNAAQTEWDKLKSQLKIHQTNQWHAAQINEGIPSLTDETSEAFVLQMSNLHLLNGVNFKKGCFPGQEIVARTRYLGKAKRRMYLATIQSNTAPLPADEICHIDADIADGSGKVVLAAQSGEQQYDLLMVANIAKAEKNELKLLSQPETKIILKKLPYSFEE